ncbi:pyrimidine 5'-nucleotidase YjjG [Paraliobacillus ryukyuensis]|uniref:Putative hydrolase of the HAD superfamily n=1 Tax=Paraliobacillus ryukyuensis TaxID=200904 RepID=A0A366EFX0_9BACI|nr:HAD family hydrolase [Paraliobacillus ryukyuensis]RBP00319.1 putative hydrolase of the HAD superfamily [Paraliobacillus ryukyuensis]
MLTIIFDVDDTLYDQSRPFKIAAQAFFDRTFTEEELHELYISSRKFSDELFHQSTTGEVSVEDLQVYRITEAAKTFEITLNRQEALHFQADYLAELKKMTLFEEVEQLLTLLHQQDDIQLAVLTNGEKEHQAMKIDKLRLDRWIPDNHLFISGALGVAKPDKRVFEIIEVQLGLDKENTIYIGDSFDHDIVGAKQVGWKAIWMNHRKRTAPRKDLAPDYEVQHPKALLDLFKNESL